MDDMRTEAATWVLTNANDNDMGAVVKGPNWSVRTVYGREGKPISWGYTPYEAWLKALMHAGYSKYLAHDLAKERCGCNREIT